MKPSRPYHSSTAYHREPGGLRRLDFFVDRIDAWKQDRKIADIRILDIGCGNGNVALPLAQIGYQATGVDYEEASIEYAKRSAEDLGLKQARFMAGSLEKVSSERFDVIIASEVLEHQKDPKGFLDDCAARLAPNGLLLLSVPNGKSLEERIRKFTTHTPFGNWLKTRIKKTISHQDVQSMAAHPHEQFFSWNELQDVLFANGWRVQEARQAAALFKEFYYLVGRLFIKRGTPLFHSLDGMDNALAPHLPLSMSDGWLLEARRFDPKRPLVMHILPTLESGGAERFVHDVAVRLPGAGFDVQVVAILRGGPLEPLFRRSVPFTILGLRGPFGLAATRALFHMFRRERPQVVHTHLFGADVWGRIAARMAGVPVIMSTEHNINTEHGYLKRRIKGWLASITTCFVAPAEIVKRNMVECEHIPPEKILVIPNGIDISRVIVRPSRGFHDVPRIMTVGRLTMQKGQATLLKALALVKGAWSLEIVGAGELEKELRELADRLAISPRIHWLGFREDIPERMAESDIFVFPSRWEGFGLALLEAAAAGVPCIASDLPVFHEFVSAKDVTFVPPADVPELAHALESLLQNPFPAIERSHRTGERLRQQFSVGATTAQYAALYHRFLKRP